MHRRTRPSSFYLNWALLYIDKGCNLWASLYQRNRNPTVAEVQSILDNYLMAEMLLRDDGLTLSNCFRGDRNIEEEKQTLENWMRLNL